MTVAQALIQNTIQPIDAEILLAHILKKNRTWLIAHSNYPISDIELKKFNALVTRRKNHEPVAYLINEKEFYGRSFFVDERVLIPRPSTETLIDVTKQLLSDAKNTLTLTKADTDIVIFTHTKNPLPPFLHPPSLIDVGTGSGCIAITLALELPDVQMCAGDISSDALTVAQENAKRHHVEHRIKFFEGNLLEPCKDMKEHFLVVSNPPYISSSQALMKDVADFEPHVGLFSGHDGMNALNQLWMQMSNHPRCMGCVIECQKEQAEKLLKRH